MEKACERGDTAKAGRGGSNPLRGPAETGLCSAFKLETRNPSSLMALGHFSVQNLLASPKGPSPPPKRISTHWPVISRGSPAPPTASGSPTEAYAQAGVSHAAAGALSLRAQLWKREETQPQVSSGSFPFL